MRHSERQITDPEVIRGILEKSDCCHLAFNDGEYPYVVTMNYGYLFDGTTITLYFHCARAGKKLDVLRADPHASFTMDCAHEYVRDDPGMHCTLNYESIVGRGLIGEVTDPAEYERAVHLLLSHHGSDQGFVLTEAHRKATVILRLVSADFTGKKKLYIPKNAPEKRQIAWELDKMSWIRMHDEATPGDFTDKPMPVDEPLGLCVTRYPKGYYKTWHRHTMGHGIFVLEGKLRTEEGIYGPGSLVWFPEGMITRHGATDEEDCLFLFISGRPGEIIFEEPPEN